MNYPISELGGDGAPPVLYPVSSKTTLSGELPSLPNCDKLGIDDFLLVYIDVCLQCCDAGLFTDSVCDDIRLY
jgi:hypothetical protein